ncbi:MAG TPA: hypothetical protein VG738_21905 [Chitinophagaceae bacterium]|nr:hypothetical protein [Chitinophagaceae bacterium]
MPPARRISYTAYNRVYFWTATIHNWQHLLLDDGLKKVITSSLKKLSDEQKINVYGFVIMPNHIHLIWQQNKPNGKETPKGSLLKYTAHVFVKHLQETGQINNYVVNEPNKKHEVWQRDAMGIEIYTRKVAIQKLNYIHNNPLQDRWRLAKHTAEYYYSSARFYEFGDSDFDFLKNIYGLFDEKGDLA